MYKLIIEPINFNIIFAVVTGLGLVLLLKDAVVKIMTFVKGLDLD